VCGKRGCWERFASGSGLARLAREEILGGGAGRVLELAGGDAAYVQGEHVAAAAVEGDADARNVVDRFAWWVALGLANLAAVFDPACIVIGGGLVEAGEVLMAPIRAHFRENLEGGGHRPEVPILPAGLGERAGAIGGALLARQVANS
jgi:glucokinase